MEHYIIHAFKTWMFRLCMFICGEMLVVATGGRGLAMKAREARCDGQGRSVWRKTLPLMVVGESKYMMWLQNH